MGLDERKKLILSIIIKEHIRTGAPVGSGILADKYDLNISPATIRNDMAELERDGLIIQPHTSAGRIPSEAGYLWHVNNIKDKRINKREEEILRKVLGRFQETDFKNTAKVLAKFSGNAVFWAFHRNNLYYTGISNLLSQPEFSRLDLVFDVSAIIDQLDEIIPDIFNSLKEGEQTIIGSANPFANFCGTVLSKYKHKDQTGIFGIIGPMRMNYEKNMGLVKFVNDKISNLN